MENQYFYTTEVEWTGERHGDLRAPVLPNVQVDMWPAEAILDDRQACKYWLISFRSD